MLLEFQIVKYYPCTQKLWINPVGLSLGSCANREVRAFDRDLRRGLILSAPADLHAQYRGIVG
jgi:hypothetical protein